MTEDQQDPAVRIAELQAVLLENPADLKTRVRLGELHFRQEEWDAGAQCYRDILAFDESADAYTVVGSAHLTADRLEEAASYLEVARNLAPESSIVAGELGVAYLRLGRPGEAEPLLRQGLAGEPENEEYRLALAKCAVVREDYWQAIELCTEILDNDPLDEQSPLLLMGDCFLAVGGLTQAQRCYAGAVELEPRNAEARAGLAHLNLWLGKEAEAEQVVLEGLAIDADNAPLQAARGQLGLHRQDFGLAAASLQRAIQLDPHYIPAYGPLAAAYLCLAQADKAAAVASQGLARSPENFECLLTAAQAAERQTQYPRAVELSHRAIARQPDNYQAHLVCARSLVQAGESLSEAKSHLAQARKLAPADAPRQAMAELAAQLERLDSNAAP